jgi:hypothetical protein
MPRSRAEVTWFSAGSPFGLTKCDSVMPSRRALAFIKSAKPSIEPPTPSATVTAMSLADFTIIIFNALSMVTRVPTLKPILVGCCAAALRDTVNKVSKPTRPSLMARSVV